MVADIYEGLVEDFEKLNQAQNAHEVLTVGMGQKSFINNEKCKTKLWKLLNKRTNTKNYQKNQKFQTNFRVTI